LGGFEKGKLFGIRMMIIMGKCFLEGLIPIIWPVISSFYQSLQKIIGKLNLMRSR
jgi:hypothetical protein